jgi:hypothetical protein
MLSFYSSAFLHVFVFVSFLFLLLSRFSLFVLTYFFRASYFLPQLIPNFKTNGRMWQWVMNWNGRRKRRLRHILMYHPRTVWTKIHKKVGQSGLYPGRDSNTTSSGKSYITLIHLHFEMKLEEINYCIQIFKTDCCICFVHSRHIVNSLS